MTHSIIAPVGLPSSGHPSARALQRRALPLPQLPTRRDQLTVYGFVSADCHGRVAFPAAVHALGWAAGTRLAVSARCGLLVVVPDSDGRSFVTVQGHFRLPPVVRRWHGLEAGSRAFVSADLDADRLVIHPVAALDVMIARWHAEVFA